MPQTLVTPRLSLRALRASDAGLMTHYCSDLRLAQMVSIPHPYPPGAAEAFIASVTGGRVSEEVWAMDATRSGGEELLGVISYKPDSESIGYWVGWPFWNTGYASEALLEVVRHLFEDRGSATLSATVSTDNPASRYVLEKAGFQVVQEADGFSIVRAEAVRQWHLALSSADWHSSQRRTAFG
ncbi:MAG: GNAT family protein [Pseudomonadota bacterium]